MKKFLYSILAVTLSASGALAANAPPLAPAKPAGVHQAQLQDGTGMIVVAGAALVGITIALATASDGPSTPNTNPATPATNTTP